MAALGHKQSVLHPPKEAQHPLYSVTLTWKAEGCEIAAAAINVAESQAPTKLNCPFLVPLSRHKHPLCAEGL